MSKKSQSVLVVGFNIRPIAYSLNKAGYTVYAVDFFGDEDLYPYVEDSIIVRNELDSNYADLTESYGYYLVDFSLKMMEKHKDIDFLIIGSGLDDDYEGRERLLKCNQNIIPLVNDLETVRKSRDILEIYDLMKSKGYLVPNSFSSEGKMSKIMTDCSLQPQEFFVLKKKRGAGGTSVYKLNNAEDFMSQLRYLEISVFEPRDWIIQEFIEGFPISCTIISDGENCEIISINHQIIGEKLLNAPKVFMYCGNIVPTELPDKAIKIISEISIFLAKALNLKGINGFDFVYNDQQHFPYLMEINPRIPGSFRASEESLGINLLELYIDSFNKDNWKHIIDILYSQQPVCYATKLVYFAPKNILPKELKEINTLDNIHDKTRPDNGVSKGEPVCTILFKGNTLSESHFGAYNVVEIINKIILGDKK